MLLLGNAHRPSDRSEYVPQYPGFERLYRVALEAAPREAHIKWPEHLHELPGEGDPQARLFLAMEAALRRLELVRNDFDVVLVHFPDAWNPATRGKFFDAHDALKALGARFNIPNPGTQRPSFHLRAQGVARMAIGDSPLCKGRRHAMEAGGAERRAA